MPRTQGKSAVKRAGGAVARTARKVATKLDPRKRAKAASAPKAAQKAKAAKPSAAQTKARAAKPKAAQTKARTAKSKVAQTKASAAKPKVAQTKPAQTKPAQTKASPPTARPVRRESDVSMDALAQEYAPSQTSIKTSFRSDGSDHERDQELPPGAGERFENEDHFTNKSGDARIGTHGRSYEANEQRANATAETRR